MEIFLNPGQHAQACKGISLPVDIFRPVMISLQEAIKGDILSGILFETPDPVHQLRISPEVLADVFQHTLGCFLFQLDIASFRYACESPVNLLFHAVMLVVQHGHEFLLKVIPPVCRADKVQHCQAVLPLAQPQSAAQLLQENRQGFRRPKEQHRVDLRNIHTFVIQIHNKDNPDFSGNQLFPRFVPQIIVGMAVQCNGRYTLFIEPVRHKVRVLNGYTEAKCFHFFHIRRVPVQALKHMICTLLRNCAGQGVNIVQLCSVISAPCPAKIVQINGVRNAKVLEGAEQLAVNRLRQTNFRRNPVVKEAKNALTVHALRCGGQPQ